MGCVRRPNLSVPLASTEDRGGRNSCPGDGPTLRGPAFVIDRARATRSNRRTVPGHPRHRHDVARRPTGPAGGFAMLTFFDRDRAGTRRDFLRVGGSVTVGATGLTFGQIAALQARAGV